MKMENERGRCRERGGFKEEGLKMMSLKKRGFESEFCFLDPTNRVVGVFLYFSKLHFLAELVCVCVSLRERACFAFYAVCVCQPL